ncbi:MAG: acyl-CoA thioesterase [Sporichthyaceae bacterium]
MRRTRRSVSARRPCARTGRRTASSPAADPVPAHVIECQIRWIDMDAYRHVNNTLYFRYCEQARTQMLGFEGSAEAAAMVLDPDARPTDGMVLASIDMAYQRPLVYKNRAVLVQSWVTRIGTSSVDIAHRVVSPADPGPGAPTYATAATVMVAYDKATGRSRPFRPNERARLVDYQDPALSLPVRRVGVAR